MSVTWDWLLLACLLAFLTKLSGYLLPAKWLESPRMLRIASAVTIGLLASLVAVNTLASGTAISLDARLGSFAVALIALLLRAPFLLVVVLGAATAALLRLCGWG